MQQALTIGNFDALHLGHQALLKKIKTFGACHVVTFSNHPSTILSPNPKKTLLTLPHRLALLKEYGADDILVLPFTEELSKKSPEEFLLLLREMFPYTHLVLGYDARIGHKRSGDPTVLGHLASKLNFSLEYLPPVMFEGSPVSSSRIREQILRGDLQGASQLLGRPYSIRGTIERGSGKGRDIGFRTMNLSVSDLCLPPLGVWEVAVDKNKGIANLGLAPTLRGSLLLEVHVPTLEKELYGAEIEVIFKRFIREEKKFLSLEDLKKQIEKDILNLK